MTLYIIIPSSQHIPKYALYHTLEYYARERQHKFIPAKK